MGLGDAINPQCQPLSTLLCNSSVFQSTVNVNSIMVPRERSTLFSEEQMSPTKENSANPSTLCTSIQETAVPRLCQIYTRDLFQFLLREEVGKLQQVSRAINATVARTGPSMLPRRSFYKLGLSLVGERLILGVSNSPLFQDATSEPEKVEMGLRVCGYGHASKWRGGLGDESHHGCHVQAAPVPPTGQ